MHIVLFTVLLKVHGNFWKKFKNKKIIVSLFQNKTWNFQNFLQNKIPPKFAPNILCSLLKASTPTGQGDPNHRITRYVKAGLLLRTREGSSAQNGSSQDFCAPNFVWSVLGAMGYCPWDGLWGASAARKPTFQPWKLKSISSSPGKLTESCLSERPLPLNEISELQLLSHKVPVSVSWHFQGQTWKTHEQFNPHLPSISDCILRGNHKSIHQIQNQNKLNSVLKFCIY